LTTLALARDSFFIFLFATRSSSINVAYFIEALRRRRRRRREKALLEENDKE
jgi:hypothetical protein